MSFMLVLRILAVVAMGWVVAHSARVVLMSVAGHERRTSRDLLGEVLSGVGAFALGWGFLPGSPGGAEEVLVIGGALLFALGIIVQPVGQVVPKI